MPWREIGNIKTLGDLRRAVNENLKDMNDETEISFMNDVPLGFNEVFTLYSGVDISYSSNSLLFYATNKD